MLPTLSSSKLLDQTLELHSDGAYSSSVCRLNAAESICLSALVSNPSLVEFFDKATWEIVGVLSIPGAQVSVDKQTVNQRCDELGNCWFSVTLPLSTPSVHLVAMSSSNSGLSNQLADIVLRSRP